MLTKFQFLLLLPLVFADNELETCEPGSKWNEYCNLCTCNEQGQTVCTQSQCDPDQPNFIYETISVGTRFCKPGDVWYEHCNTCRCLGLERAFCTKYDCQKSNWVYNKQTNRRGTGINAEGKCTPGTTWKEDCNTCFCTKNGYVGCTMKACSSDLFRPKRDAGRKCIPGTTWKEDCNTCFCSKNGYVGCTLMACYSHLHRSKRDEERKCIPGTTWKEDCNTCFCSKNGYAGCTLKACSSHLHRSKRDEERKCIPGTTWKVDCNTCFCSENGYVGCTLKACFSHLHRSKRDEAEEELSEVSLQELEKNCELGTTKKVECNICYCTAMGFACTKRICHGQEVSVIVEE